MANPLPYSTLNHSFDGDIPTEGTRVTVTVNKLGPGTVTGLFVEDGWLGVIVECDTVPDWATDEQRAKSTTPAGGYTVHAFGAEISRVVG